MEMISQLSASKIEELVKKAANKIADDKLHSDDVLQELKSKFISLQWELVKLRQILQNSII